MNVPYVNLAAQHAPIKDELLASFSDVLDHSQFILGPEVAEFEKRFAELCGTEYSVGVNSGTDALILALKALGIGPGDEVITAPNSFVASASCIGLVGATPVFVDVCEDYNLDPKLIEQAITPQTRAILPVYLTGRTADMNAISDVALRHGLYVIEDCAQAVGASFEGRLAGSLGTVGCFSLHPLKTLNACGDAGILTTNDRALYEEFILQRNHGLQSRDDSVSWSINSRLDTIQAAILLVKLKYWEEWTEQRRSNAHVYQKLLADIPGVDLPIDLPNEYAVYHTFVIQAERRDALQAHLNDAGIGTAIHYPTPIHLQTAAASLGYVKGSFPVTERLAGRILSLPIYPELRHEELEYVASNIRSFYQVA